MKYAGSDIVVILSKGLLILLLQTTAGGVNQYAVLKTGRCARTWLCVKDFNEVRINLPLIPVIEMCIVVAKIIS